MMNHISKLIHLYQTIEYISFSTVCLQKIPDISSCNLRKHCRIFIIFGIRITEKAANQQML